MSAIDKFERTEKDQKRCEEIHDKFRDDLLKRQLSNSESYDKAILSLSSSALALSLTAIKFVVPLDGANYLCLLKISWGLFLLTVLLSLSAFLISNHAISRQLIIAEKYYIKALVSAQTETNVFTRINSTLNHLTGFVFILAISMVIFFVTINIHGDINMSKKESKTSVFHTDSATIPTMQVAPGTEGHTTLSADIPTMQMAPGTTTAQREALPTGSDNSTDSSSSE